MQKVYGLLFFASFLRRKLKSSMTALVHLHGLPQGKSAKMAKELCVCRSYRRSAQNSENTIQTETLCRFACKCARILFSYGPRNWVPLPAIMLQPSNSLDFRRQRHHVKPSALKWMLTFWPRDEPSRVSFLACNLISFDCPGHVGCRLKIPLPPRWISRRARQFKERPTID
jgi:hypothetical protein